MRGVIMLHGLPSSGKSWLAEQLRKRLQGSVVLKTVNYRQINSLTDIDFFDEENLTTRRQKDAAYLKMIREAQNVVSSRVVILDGTFHKRHRREWVYKLAQEYGVRLVVISVSCSEKEIMQRLKNRMTEGGRDAIFKSPEAFMLVKQQTDELTEILDSLVFKSSEDDVRLLLEKVSQSFEKSGSVE